MNFVLRNARIVDSCGVRHRHIHIKEGRIYYDEVESAGDATAMDLSGRYVLPGLVDIHFHGMKQFDFTSGWYDAATGEFDESSQSLPRGLKMLQQALAAHGVTGFYVATQAHKVEYLQQRLDVLADYMAEAGKTVRGARLWGALLEGSFINPVSAGAQNAELIIPPDAGAFDTINRSGAVRLATVVPDYDEASYSLIRYLTGRGVVVGAGHTRATGEQVAQAVKAGLRYCIHFTNGLMSNSYKPFDGGGSVEGVLREDTLDAEIIADGFHIAPGYVRDILSRKGYEHIIGVTDAMFATESELKRITWVGKEACVGPGRQYIGLATGGHVLAGSLLMMDRAVENMLNWLTVEMPGVWNRRHPALTLEQALAAAAQMYAENPCRLTSLDREGFGRLAEGSPADLCIVRIDGKPGNYHLCVEKTLVGGVTVYERCKNEKEIKLQETR